MVVGYGTRTLVAVIMLLQVLKVVRVVKAPAVRCDDALNTTPVPAKIQSVEEVGAKKCVQAWVFELATAARPVTATLKGSAIGILDDHAAGAVFIEPKLEFRLARNQVVNLFELLNGYHCQILPLGDLLVDQVFFTACINELALNVHFQDSFPILAVAL